MNRIRLAWAACLCFAAPLAAADDFSDYLKASAQLAALPQPARAASPEAAPLFATLADNNRFLESRSFTRDDLAPLAQMCDAPVQLATRYIMHNVMNTGIAANATQKQIGEAAMAQSERNIQMYQDELALLLSFVVRCNARTVPLIESAFGSLSPEQINEGALYSARQVQQSSFNNLAGNITLMSRKQMNEANTLRIARAMAETAPTYVSALPLAERAKLADLATTENSRLSGEQAAIVAQVIQVLQDKHCGKLCMVAPPQPSAFLPYVEASKQLLALPSPARQSNPQGAALLAVLSDRQRFLEGAVIGQARLDELTTVCEASKTVIASYMDVDKDAKVRVLVKNPQDQAAYWKAVMKVMGQNAVKFQDEITPVRAFGVHCKARMIPLLAAQLSALAPEQREARLAVLRDFQQGLMLDFINVLNLASKPDLRPAHTRVIVQAMIDVAPVLAAALPVDTRQTLMGMSKGAPLKASSGYAKESAQILRSLENPECENLCKF